MNFKGLSYFFLNKLVLSNRTGSLIRRIALLSFFAISLSLAAFFIVLFVMNGMNRNIKARVIRIEPHLTTINKVEANAQILSEVKQAQVVSYHAMDVIARSIDGQFRGAQALGYSTDGLKIFLDRVYSNRKIRNSNYYNDDDASDKFELALNEVAVGVGLARSMGVLEGDELTLVPPETLLLSSLETPVFQKVMVKRILVTDLQDVDDQLIIYNSELSLRNFKATLSSNQGFHIWFNDVENAEKVQAILKKKSINSVTWQERNADLFFALKIEKLNIGILLAIAGLIASTSVLTVLALLMSQKKRDIAIIKTLGLSQRKTLLLFTKIGLWISGSAIILGSVIGIGISLYLQYFPLNILPNIYYDSSIPSLVDYQFAIFVILIAAFLALLGSYFPAKATLEIEPAILLKQKN